MLRIIGYTFASLALLAFALDVWRGPMQEQELIFTSMAEYWSGIDPNSLVGFQAMVEKNISPELWFQVVLPALGLPAFVLLGLFAALFFIIGRPRRKLGRDGLMFPNRRR